MTRALLCLFLKVKVADGDAKLVRKHGEAVNSLAETIGINVLALKFMEVVCLVACLDGALDHFTLVFLNAVQVGAVKVVNA